jgi:drug/metabolite transporter (DMT)-like permease
MPPTPTPLLLLGIVCGFITAAAHAVAFAISRRYIVLGHGSSLRLMVMSHAMMGPLAIVVLLASWSDELRRVTTWAPLMLGASLTYLVGQALFFISLRRTAASRLVPLLGLKTVAVIPPTMVLLGEKLSWIQGAAVALSLVAGAMLHHIGGRLPWRALLSTLVAVCLFALSDVYIILLVRQMGTGDLAAAARSVGLVYGFCGLAVLPLLPRLGTRRASDWLAAAPHAACWLPSMYTLFACLALCGAVLGNIVVGTRGLFAIALGAILASRGMFHIEHHASRGEIARRFAAAVLMIAAIAIYGLGKSP